MKVEPASIPAALAAFRDAKDRVGEKLAALQSLQIREWAEDPVSSETAQQFAERTNGGDAASALACLTGYEKQLTAACDALQRSYDAYMLVEGDNTARWGKYDNG
ncbi:hypothetical protein [Actinokineospora xionganensis]|uniref:PE family protein n=1 Tax=Actinokineospora xionganensis TaxID=2684470 RepID=A0ABR7L1Y6_9PSEU|nr:hypothetical protein [Actinokineospora xionganensis]MBC6446701.1 hypothetical protein [Actinokineospora xionganensis]